MSRADFTDFAPSDDDHCEDEAAYLDEAYDDLRAGEVRCFHCKERDLASEMTYDARMDRYLCHLCAKDSYDPQQFGH